MIPPDLRAQIEFCHDDLLELIFASQPSLGPEELRRLMHAVHRVLVKRMGQVAEREREGWMRRLRRFPTQ
jgi:hypothetical protein